MTIRVALVQPARVFPDLPAGSRELAAIGSARLIGDGEAIASSCGRAALVGFAFERNGALSYLQLGRDAVERIIASEGGWAVANLWGNFILMWEGNAGQIFLLRSPLTGPAIFQTGHNVDGVGGLQETHCAFTDLALARSLGFPIDEPDAGVIDAYLRYPLLRSPRSGIAGVTEILPGEISRLDRPGRLAASWLPWDYAKSPPRRAEPEELANVVRACVGAWSERFARVQLELSGGIDSSIVAACLAGRSRPWRAVTMVTPGPDGDERVYARAVAARAAVSLDEIRIPDEPADPLAPARGLRVRPGGFGLVAPTDAAFLASARAFGADAIFSGTAGDGAFGYQTSIAPALDALRYAGIRAALRAAADQAEIMDDNIWNALRHGLRAWFRGIRLWPVDDLLLSTRDASERPRHPWLADAGRVPPGQRRYGLGLLAIQPFLDGYERARHVPKIAPLLSQPLIEFGLGVPSWQWGEGGVNRALAREAFRENLPEIVLTRRSKGRILSMFLPAFEANRQRLSSFLLDGWLAGSGILDLDAIDALLAGRTQADTSAMLRILEFADIERWARSIAGSDAHRQ